jgi:hypothetical protein
MAKKDSNLGLARYLRRDRAERCEMSTKETRPENLASRYARRAG